MKKKTYKKNFKKLQIFITIIFLCMFIVGPLPNHDFVNDSGQETTNNSLINIPKIQDYNTNSSGETSNINITLHQAYNNKSIFEINETSTFFTVPAPNATDFSSSYINISMDDLSVNNVTYIIEESAQSQYPVDSTPCLASFEAPSNCYLNNASFYTWKNNLQNGTMTVYLYQSKNESNVIIPDVLSELPIGSITVDNSADGEWENDTFSNIFLDNSNTFNNTWFIGLKDDGGIQKDSLWERRSDSSNGDNSLGYEGLTLIDIGGGVGLDFLTRVGLGIDSITINATDINLSLNSTQFTDDSTTSGSGYWDSTQRFHGINNELNFSISADWFNFEFNITDIQVNYTKSMIANSSYTVEGGSDVYWESEAIFTAFDHRLNNNTLNFTIPSSWTVNDLKNDSNTIIIDNTFLDGSSKIITVYDTKATDGNWILYCNSINLLSNVKIGVGGKETTIAYSNETLEFNVTFSKPITGNVNLSVYNNSLNGEILFSKNSSVTDVSEVTLNSWVISDNLTTYGDHKVQVTWNNETDIAIIDSIITIAGETTYSIQNINETEVLNNANAFNITVEYYDEFNLYNVTGATVGYNLNLGDGWQSQVQNNIDETYNITINPADFPANGLKTIPITINKTNHMNYTFNYNFYIVTDTKVQELTANSTLDVIRGHNATYYLNFTEEIGDTPISAATISKETLNSSIEWSFDDLTGGNYSINLNTSQLDVGEYFCNFSIALTDFKTQIFDFNITVSPAETELQFINVTDIVSRASGLNATVYFWINDVSNSQNLTSVPTWALTVYNGSDPANTWDTGDWNWDLVEVGDGKYYANISLNGLDYGDYSVILNVSYTPNYNFSTLNTQFHVRGNFTEVNNMVITGNTLNLESAKNYSIYQHVTTIDVEFDFVDIEDGYYPLTFINTGNSVFDYWVYLDGTTLLNDDIAWDLGFSNNNGTITLGSLDSGLYNITLIVGLLNYENATYSFNLTIQDLTTSITIDDVQQLSVQLGESAGSYDAFMPFEITVNITYTDTINGNPISGASYAVLEYDSHQYNSTYYGNNKYGWVILQSDLVLGITTVTIYMGKKDYQNATDTFDLSLTNSSTEIQFNDDIRQPDHTGAVPLIYNITSDSYIAYSPFDITINMTWVDLNHSSAHILDASYMILNFNNTNYTSNYYGNNMYGWVIPQSDLEVGFFTISIYLGKDNYNNATYTFNVTIEDLTTGVIFTNDIYQIERSPVSLEFTGENFVAYIPYTITINASYFDYTYSTYLTGATALLEYNGFNYTDSYYSNDMYGWIIPQSDLIYGVESIQIHFSLGIYENATYSFNIIVVDLETSIIFNDDITQPDHTTDSLNYSIVDESFISYLPYALTINVSYYDDTNSEYISGATQYILNFNGVNYSSNYYDNNMYGWVIPQSDLSLGKFTTTIYLGLENYDNQTYTLNITVEILPTYANFIDISQPEQETGTLPFENNSSYLAFSTFDIAINITYIDIVTGNAISGSTYAVLMYGGVNYSRNYFENGIYGWLIPNDDLIIGKMEITIYFGLEDYQNATLVFNLTVILEYSISIEFIDPPESLQQGEYIDLIFRITYLNDTTELALVGASISLLTNNTEITPLTNETNSEGIVIFRLFCPAGDYSELALIIRYDGQLYGVLGGEDNYGVSIQKQIIIPPWAIWAMIIFGVGAVSAVAIQKKIIAPRKLHYTDLIMSSATIFDDAINLQHLMIIYKNTGTSIFFKSFADEKLDPDLISGFLTAVQSFGKELKTQKSLNEIAYGDKVLLFSDGDYIRVTLVLGKSPSPYMKRNLAKFIGKFEAHYQLTLQVWKGQLNIFQDAADLIDEILHTSVILPHEIAVDSKLEKNLRNSYSKQILSIARGLVSEDRKFLFLAQLLADSIEQTKKDSAEIILSINDLLECKVLIPIKIEKLEEQELSEQEIRTLAERVSVIPNKTDQEKQDLMKEMLILSSAEREVVLSSLMQSITITTEISGETITAKKFENVKEAKKEIKTLENQAKGALKELEFDEAIKFYEIAEIISYQWNMDSSGKKYGNLVITTAVEKYRTTIKLSQKQGRKYEKNKEFDNAITEYEKLLASAHNLFKLGFLDVEALIKEYTKKVAEIKKQTKQAPSAEDFLTKDHLLRQRKKLLSKWKKVQKSKDMIERNELTTKLLIISNFLFKFGQVSESANIKKYHNDLDEIRNAVEESNEVYMQETATRISELKLKKQQFLEYAKEAEVKEDYVNALVIYQQALNTYCQVGDAENAIRLSLKIEELFRKIPNLQKIINDYKAEAVNLRASGDLDNASINDKYAETLEDALFIPRE